MNFGIARIVESNYLRESKINNVNHINITIANHIRKWKFGFIWYL